MSRPSVFVFCGILSMVVYRDEHLCSFFYLSRIDIKVAFHNMKKGERKILQSEHLFIMQI